MFKRKNRTYIALIIYKKNNKNEIVEVMAKTKKEAYLIVEDILIKCDLFNVKTNIDFELKILKKGGTNDTRKNNRVKK